MEEMIGTGAPVRGVPFGWAVSAVQEARGAMTLTAPVTCACRGMSVHLSDTARSGRRCSSARIVMSFAIAMRSRYQDMSSAVEGADRDAAPRRRRFGMMMRGAVGRPIQGVDWTSNYVRATRYWCHGIQGLEVGYVNLRTGPSFILVAVVVVIPSILLPTVVARSLGIFVDARFR